MGWEHNDMKSITGFMMAAMLLTTGGCDNDGQPIKAKAVGTVVLKSQLESLEKAKDVEQTVLDAAAQQKEQIEAGTQ